MNQESTIIILPEFEATKNSSLLDTIEFKIDILDKTAYFKVGITNRQATLSDIVPLARTIATKLAIILLEHLGETGLHVPCRKGCSACCSYLIPLSVPEAFRLRQELSAMPADSRKHFLQPCLDAAEKILNSQPQTLCTNTSSQSSQDQMNNVSQWYSKLNMKCPFLSDNLCSRYEQRPLACREHIVIGSAIACGINQMADQPEVAQMPVSILESLGTLTAELEQMDIEAIMLPLAFAWAQDNLQRSQRTWPATAMIEHFVEILKELAAEKTEMLASSF